MDGEGSIFHTGPTGRARYLRVVVTNTSEPMLEWLTAHVGGHLSLKQTSAMTRTPCWTWAVIERHQT